MQIFALLTFGTSPASALSTSDAFQLGSNDLPYATREEEAEVASGNLVGFCISSIFCDDASACSSSLGEVLVFAVATGPFIIPDIEYSSCLWRRLGLHGRGIDLWPRWALLLANNLLHLSFCRSCDLVILVSGCECGRRFFRSWGFRRHHGKSSGFDVGHIGDCYKEVLVFDEA